MSFQRIVIYGGNGFVGSHIAKGRSEYELCTLCLSRTGHKPAHLRDQPWSEKVKWCCGDASEPNVKLLSSADAMICCVGSPPLPTFSKSAYEQQVFNNGITNANAIKAAGEAGCTRVILISAHIPSLMNRDSFGYAKGKKLAEEAAHSFSKLSDQHSAVILRPGVIYGTRHTIAGKPIPLGTMMRPFGKLLPSQFVSVDRLAKRVTNALLEPENYAQKVSVFAGREI